MASKKVGTLIKEARVNADLTQEQLARKISGLSASDISLAERGMKDLTQEQLKKIAKVTGVTQASLINAAKGSSGKKTTSSASRSSMQVTASEKKLVELYRKASTEDRKAALKALKGEDSLTDDIFEALLDNISKEKVLDTLMDGVQDILSKK
jgi:transcriptional regulator with XRE-family HTH domain